MPIPTFLHRIVAASLVLVLAACATETAEEATSEEEMAQEQEYASTDALNELRAQYMDHVNTGNAPMVAELYAEDALYMPSSGHYAAGPEAIRARAEEIAAAAPTLTITPVETEISGDWAIERGTYSTEVTPEGGEVMSQSGRYLTLSRRQADGSFKLHWVLSNYDAPPPPEAQEGMATETAEVMAGGDPELAALAEEWQTHYNLGHPEMTAELHAEDGVVMGSAAPTAEGRAAIQAYIAEQTAASAEATITQAATEIFGDWAVGRGTYETQLTPAEGETINLAGYWMTVCRRDDAGEWKIQWLITNAVAPIPTME